MRRVHALDLDGSMCDLLYDSWIEGTTIVIHFIYADAVQYRYTIDKTGLQFHNILTNIQWYHITYTKHFNN